MFGTSAAVESESAPPWLKPDTPIRCGSTRGSAAAVSTARTASTYRRR